MEKGLKPTEVFFFYQYILITGLKPGAKIQPAVVFATLGLHLQISHYVKPLIIPNNPKGFNLGSPLL